VNAWQDLSIHVRDDEIALEANGERYSAAPLDERTLTELETLRQESGPSEYGARLFDAFFVNELRAGYASALARRAEGWRFHLNVATSEPRLAGLRWESLYAAGPPPLYLGLSYQTPFSRHLTLDAPGPGRPAVSEEKLKVLVVISNPTDIESSKWRLPRLDEDAIVDRVDDAMRPVRDRIEHKFQTRPASLGSIRERLADEGFHVLHVFGSGALAQDEAEGCLVLENDHEHAEGVGQKELAELVMQLPDLRVVVLSSCQDAPRSGLTLPRPEVFVELAPKMIEYGVPAVVVMRDRVNLEVAGLFTEKFYAALARSRKGGIDQVVNRARDSIFFHRSGTWDWTIPVLFLSGDGVLFEPAEEMAVESATSMAHRPPLAIAREQRRPAPANPFELVHGKATTPGSPAHEKKELWKDLLELDLTHDELTAICAEFDVPPQAIQVPTLQGRSKSLVEFVVASGVGSDLRRRLSALQKTRVSVPPAATVYDIGERRVARGTF
jgi:CHAT domain